MLRAADRSLYWIYGGPLIGWIRFVRGPVCVIPWPGALYSGRVAFQNILSLTNRLWDHRCNTRKGFPVED